MTNVRRLHQQRLDSYLKLWEEQPLTVFLEFNTSPSGFYGLVAQYEFQSMADLKTKLAQFPSGTMFVLFSQRDESAASVQSIAELDAFLKAHDMSPVSRKRGY